ncbi:MAG: O-acetyl-ADP-ribose deacetylase [Candidatus Eisenbacteria bacterium]|nr:O-acetyl-ADP-ribose deacetylase [Candidatus Eisenbacteria bacterium]
MSRNEYRVGRSVVELLRGDITQQTVDAIVNAANAALAGGGGVDGAIHRAGGPTIGEECRRIGGCPTGSAVATGAGRLPARWVIHAVGPVWRGGRYEEPALLASAYRRSLEVAREIGARSIAFPSISTGAYLYPVPDAARVALTAVREALEVDVSAPGAGTIDRVVFVLFSDADLATYEEAAAGVLPREA